MTPEEEALLRISEALLHLVPLSQNLIRFTASTGGHFCRRWPLDGHLDRTMEMVDRCLRNC
jgi:hypothetical protein